MATVSGTYGGKDLVAAIEGVVGRLRVVSKELKTPLNDDVPEVRQLCQDLETVLRYQQKDKVNFWGEKRDYYHFLTQSISGRKDLEQEAKKIQGFPKLTTPQGRGRGLLRLCLSEGNLAECIQTAVNNEKITKEWYQSAAVLRLPSLTSRLLVALYDLAEFQFDLPCDDLDLNESWPTFQRKQFHPSFNQTDSSLPSGKSSFQGLLSGPKTAELDITLSSIKSKPRTEKVEHATEEEPSEVFIKEEITLDIPFAVQVLSEIVGNLEKVMKTSVSAQELTQHISKWEDLPRGLLGLRNCITEWIKAVQAGMRQKDIHIQDLESQLQETMEQSEISESSLVSQLRDAQSEVTKLKASNKSMKREMEETCRRNQALEEELATCKETIDSLEDTNFGLQERLVNISTLVDSITTDISSHCEGEEAVDVGGDQEDPDDKNDLKKKAVYVENRLTLVKSGCTKLAKEITQLQQEKNELTMSLEMSWTEVNAEDVAPMPRQRVDTFAKIEEIGKERVILEKERKTMQEAISKKDDELGEALNELAKKSVTEEELTKSLSNLQSKCSNLEQQLLQKEAINVGLQAQFTTVEDKCGRLEDQLAQVQQQVSVREEEMEKWKEEHKQVQEELRSSQSMMDEETSSLKFRISALVMERDKASQLYQRAQEDLQTFRDKILLEEDSKDKQVSQKELILTSLRTELQESNVKWQSFQEQLAEVSLLRDKDREELMRTSKEKDRLKEQIKSDSVKSELLEKENEELRRAIRGLLKQKASLWQHALELEDNLSLTWQESKNITKCIACQTAFTMLNRKHHCRSCGLIFCGGCCGNKMQTTFSKAPVRACNSCYQRRNSKSKATCISNEELEQTIRNFQDNSSLCEDDDTDTQSQSGYGSSYNSYSTPPATNNTREYSVISLVDGEVGEGLPYTLRTVEGFSEGTPDPICIVDKIGGDQGTVSDSNPLHNDTDLLPNPRDRISNSQLNMDELKEKLESLKTKGEASRSDGGERRESVQSKGAATTNLQTEVDSISLRAGQSHEVTVQIDKARSIIEWEFQSEPKGLAFAMYYIKSDQRTEVLPSRRCASHKTKLTGKVVAQKEGQYVLVFDNGFSKFAGCSLQYKVITKLGH